MAAQSKLRSVLIIAAFAAVLAVIVTMGLFAFPIPLPVLPLGPYQQFIVVGLIILATKLAMDLLKPLFRMALHDRVAHEADIYSLFQLVSYLIWAGVLLGILFVFVGVGAIDALGVGVVFAAVIIVLQKPILNLLGWGVLVTRRLYKLGDRIELNQVKGYVTQITLMKTVVREFGGWMGGDTFTGRYVALPNSNVLEENVYNYTRDTEFIWDEISVAVTYESDHKVAERYLRDAAEAVVGDLMRNNRGVVRSKYEFADLATYMVEEPTVTWTLGESSVNLHIVYFCPSYRRRYYRTEIVKRVLESFASDARVAIAYPHVEFVPYKASEMEVDSDAQADSLLDSLRQ
ncbi:MAG: mechanosensitive ion channel domain-containing protein [Thermoplasmata archaeon]